MTNFMIFTVGEIVAALGRAESLGLSEEVFLLAGKSYQDALSRIKCAAGSPGPNWAGNEVIMIALSAALKAALQEAAIQELDK